LDYLRAIRGTAANSSCAEKVDRTKDLVGMDDKDITLIYVGGYGRSGSTVLSIMLGNIKGVFNGGEIAALSKYMGISELGCSCGKKYVNCPVWGKIINGLPGGENFIHEMETIRQELEGVTVCTSKLGTTSRKQEEYASYIRRFFEEVVSVSESSVIVDASKTAYNTLYRHELLKKEVNVNVQHVHLLRGIKAVASSCKKGSNTSMELEGKTLPTPIRVVKSIVGWYISNIAATNRSDMSNSVNVTYSEIINDEIDVLDRILRSSVIDQKCEKNSKTNVSTNKYTIGHMVGGNRLARNNDIIHINRDKSSLENLNSVEHLLCEIVHKLYTFYS
jgi:hypothetical protein